MPLESDGPKTLRLLDALEAEVRHLQSKAKRLSAALDKAKQKVGLLEQLARSKAKGARRQKPPGEPAASSGSSAPAVADLVAPKSQAPRKRQALGMGLAQIRNRYAPPEEETVENPANGTE